MSSKDLAVRVRGISKSYRIRHSEPAPTTAAEAILDRIRRPFYRHSTETFWALHDVSFDIREGELVGIIGRNGAGKSTLLKILSRITQPTEGEARLYGRVGSLLEVGSGFHPELTGRENIYLNGAILGMSRGCIARRFDDIVEFAGVAPFLDTPVKRFSSGMYLRLAFAVAAHLEPDILVVDEVLAVGDAEFQARCVGKMRDVSSSGCTVLFVSHNLAAIGSLCSRALLLDRGRLVCDDSVARCLTAYSASRLNRNTSLWERPAATPPPALCFTRAALTIEGEQPYHTLCLHTTLRSSALHKAAFIAVEIHDQSGTSLMQALPTMEGFINSGNLHHDIRTEVELPPLIPGNYLVTVWVGSHNTETLDEVRECLAFSITTSPTRNRTYPHGPSHGHIVPHASFRYSARPSGEDAVPAAVASTYSRNPWTSSPEPC